MKKVSWTKTALDDLDGIREFIARDSIYYAEKLVDDVFAKVDNLEIFPEMGRIVPERNDPNFRELIFGSYRIMYKIDGKCCIVTTIIHGKRLYHPDEMPSEKYADGFIC